MTKSEAWKMYFNIYIQQNRSSPRFNPPYGGELNLRDHAADHANMMTENW